MESSTSHLAPEPSIYQICLNDEEKRKMEACTLGTLDPLIGPTIYQMKYHPTILPPGEKIKLLLKFFETWTARKQPNQPKLIYLSYLTEGKQAILNAIDGYVHVRATVRYNTKTGATMLLTNEEIRFDNGYVLRIVAKLSSHLNERAIVNAIGGGVGCPLNPQPAYYKDIHIGQIGDILLPRLASKLFGDNLPFVDSFEE